MSKQRRGDFLSWMPFQYQTIDFFLDIDMGCMSVHNLNSTSNRHLITNVISTSDHRHFLDIDIGCMSVHNLNSTFNRHLITNLISPSDHVYVDIFLDKFFIFTITLHGQSSLWSELIVQDAVTDLELECLHYRHCLSTSFLKMYTQMTINIFSWKLYFKTKQKKNT